MATLSNGNAVEPSIVKKVAYIFSASDDEGTGGINSPTATSTRRGGGRGQKHRTRQDEDRRSAKKRRTADDDDDDDAGNDVSSGIDTRESTLSAFPTLLQGRETPAAVALRQQLYTSTWARLECRIQEVLQDANQATLHAVMDFINKPISTKLPSAFIVLGPAATADSLLFPQLAAALAESPSDAEASSVSRRPVRRLVRFRAAEALNLRAALKTVVQEVTASAAPDDDAVAQDGYRYLSYDLEAVAAALPPASSLSSSSSSSSSSRIVIAFEDSEAFDARLLADLIAFLHSWLDRIPFVLLFGVATSVDLFQARLAKQAAHRLAAAQFDVAPSSAVLDRLVACGVATAATPLRLGPALLRSLLERQDEQVTGVSVFVRSVQYAYMCYFYGNPLSVLLEAGDSNSSSSKEEKEAADGLLASPDYQAAVRQLPSFRRHVEALVAAGNVEAARQLLDDRDDAGPLQQAVRSQLRHQRRWTVRLLRALHVAAASGAFAGLSFSALYIRALGGRMPNSDAAAASPSLVATLIHAIQRMSAPDLIALIQRLVTAVQQGNSSLGVEAVSAQDDDGGSEDGHEADWQALPARLEGLAAQVEALQKTVLANHAADRRRNRQLAIQAGAHGGSIGSIAVAPPPLRSKYTAQGKVLRTTVVAQKVQLSRAAQALTDEDQAFTALVDAVVDAVAAVVGVEGVEGEEGEGGLWLQEVWLYDARTPYRDVFLPKPGDVVERALARPHDYLACACCRPADREQQPEGQPREGDASIRSTLPATAILYQLYREAGPLINVADLWDAFLAVVGGDREETGGEGADREVAEGAVEERKKGGPRTGGKKKKKETDEMEDDGDDDAAAASDDDTRERRHLVQFYQALAEMKALGYVKATRRKVDHVAKVKWL